VIQGLLAIAAVVAWLVATVVKLVTVAFTLA
jgi:hypothetical protein